MINKLEPSGPILFKPDSNIKYAWSIYTTKNLKDIKNVLLWGYAGPGYHDYNEEIENYHRRCFRGFTHIFEKFNLLAFSIFLPRKYFTHDYPDFKFNSQIMTQETMIEDTCKAPDFYNRPDLEILKIINKLKIVLRDNGITNVSKEILAGGVSSGANLANRFSLLYPNLVKGVALFCAGDLMYPTDQLDNLQLKYPFGTSDINKIEGNKFDIEKYKTIPHYIYVGEEDTNDPMPYELGSKRLLEDHQRILSKSLPERAEKYADYLKFMGMKVKLNIEPDIGHSVEDKHVIEAFNFLIG